MTYTLKTAYYDEGTGNHSTLTAEPTFISFTQHHQLNTPQLVTIRLIDVDGAMTQKYKTISGTSTYPGSGRVTLDEDATVFFDGRILDVRTVHELGEVMLICADWMSQLSDPVIHYDTREDIDGSGLRESTLRTNIDEVAAKKKPVWEENGTDFFMSDARQTWTADQWNPGTPVYYVVFSHRMAGSITMTTGPYDEVVTPAIDFDSPANGETEVWDDDVDEHGMFEDTDDYAIEYFFNVYVDESYFYVAGPSKAQINLSYFLKGDGPPDCDVEIYDYTGAGYRVIGHIDGHAVQTKKRESFAVPGEWLDDIVDSNGQAKIRLTTRLNGLPDRATWFIYQVELELDYETTGDTDVYEILDTLPKYLEVDTDLTLANANKGLWETAPYSIVQRISNHVNGMVTGYDPLITLATTVEATNVYLCRHYKEQKPFKILADWARGAGAVFWCYLDAGSPKVQWKKTWTPGTPDATLTDADVLAWELKREWAPLMNEYHISGMRYSQGEVYLDTSTLSPDPGVDSKTTFGITRAKFIADPGIYTLYEAEEIGKTLVERDEDIQDIIVVTLAGRSSLELGDYVVVNSTFLGKSSVDYWLIEYQYDHTRGVTILSLHPDVASDKFIEYSHQTSDVKRVYEEAIKGARLVSLDPEVKDVW